MVINEPVAELRTAATVHAAPLVARDGDFEKRWAAWIAGRSLHEQRVGRRFVVATAVVAITAAIALAFSG